MCILKTATQHKDFKQITFRIRIWETYAHDCTAGYTVNEHKYCPR